METAQGKILFLNLISALVHSHVGSGWGCFLGAGLEPFSSSERNSLEEILDNFILSTL